MSKKFVYLFSEGNGSMRELLGGKGANLAEMTSLGMPVTLSQAKITLTEEQVKECAEKALPWGPTEIAGYEPFTVESCMKLLESVR